MRRIISLSILASLCSFAPISFAGSGAGFQPLPDRIVETARDRTLLDIRYDPKYVRLDYPGGDVAPDTGVCTDVIIRTFRDSLRFDFQKAVHEDMKAVSYTHLTLPTKA